MPLQLKKVNAARGARWVGDGLRIFARRPFPLTLLLLVYAAAGTLLTALMPLVGALLQLMSLPLLSLGFMVATRSALSGGPIHPGQFIEPLRAAPPRRRALLALCASYGAIALAVLLLCAWISDDALTRLQALMAEGGPGAQGEQAREQIDALLAEPGLAEAALLLAVLGTALSVPYWFAPALVHWAGQGVGQSLFSSALALWRNRGAFFVFAGTWALLLTLLSVLLSALLAALGAGRAAGLVLMPVALLFSTVFYTSQWFAFADCYDGAGTDEVIEPPATTGS